MTASIELPSSADLCMLVGEVWSTFLGDQMRPLELSGSAGRPSPTATAVSSAVSIDGPWSGQITLELTSAGADQLARAMFDLPTGELPAVDIADAVGELGNIIAGNIKSSLPEPSTLSLPEVRIGAAANPATGRPALVEAVMAWGAHHVVVCLTETAPPQKVGI